MKTSNLFYSSIIQAKPNASRMQILFSLNKVKSDLKINCQYFLGLTVKTGSLFKLFCRRKTIMNSHQSSFLMTDSPSLISLVPSLLSQDQQHQGKWTDRQNATYIAFLQFNRNVFRRKQKRRVHKFYKQMSSFIKTRTPVQCRSHHQKLESKYRYPNRIISSYKENQDLTLYEEEKFKFDMISQKNQKKQPTIQKPIQRESFAIQTDFQGKALHFVKAEDYFRKPTYGIEASMHVNNWNPVYYYPLHSYYPYGLCRGDECKVQQVATNYQVQVLPKQEDQRDL